jgi:hypothetical protein
MALQHSGGRRKCPSAGPQVKKESLSPTKNSLSFKNIGPATACNPSYSGGRDQENHGSKQIVCETLSRKTPSQKMMTIISILYTCMTIS